MVKELKEDRKIWGMTSRNGLNGVILGKLKEDLKIETFRGKWCITCKSKI